MNRRHFLHALAAAPLMAVESRSKAPFRVLYSNDTTNITSCVSPFHQAREPFRKEMLDATVDEVAGLVDAHFLQPGLGVVPMWPSKVLPLAEHYAWIKQRYAQKPDSFGQFVLNGGDVVKVFIDRCRAKGQAAFISFRMNDVHHKEFVDLKPGYKPGSSIGMSVTKFYADHPEHRIKPGSQRGADLVHNFAVPEVRAQKLALIRELCENYDLDGLELDFLRFYSYFRDDTPLEQRRAIMTGLVKEVRQMLWPKRWLCARVPYYLTALDALKAVREPQTLAKAPHHCFLASGWRSPGAKPLPVPRKIEPNKPAKFSFDLAAPVGGWKHDARVRLQTNHALTHTVWIASFNGEAIEATDEVSEPFAVPFPSMFREAGRTSRLDRSCPSATRRQEQPRSHTEVQWSARRVVP